MRFLARRTSTREDRPCTEAYRASCRRVDMRTVDDPRKIQAMSTELWYAEGENHRVVNGMIARDFPDEQWFVDIPDLDALLVFVAAYGEMVVGYDHMFPDLLFLEIYDDHRE